MARTLGHLLPRILDDINHDIRTFNGKKDLLAKLPNRLKGYSNWFSGQERIAVVVDRDDDDCRILKEQLELFAHEAGLSCCRVATGMPGIVLNRIAVEELEAWFFGDVDALRVSYPRVAASLDQRARFRDPDAITGGTWEALQKVLQDAGYHQGGLRKLTLADEVAPHLSIDNNRSASFRTFVSGVRYLTEGAA